MADVAERTIPCGKPPESHLHRGQLLPDALVQPVNREPALLSDLCPRHNLVVVLAGGCGRGRLPLVDELMARFAEIEGEEAEVVVAVRCSAEGARDAQLAAPRLKVVVDQEGSLHCRWGAVNQHQEVVPAVYITDRFREIFAVFRAAGGETLPSADEVLEWLRFINIQCEECYPPEWPADAL